MIHTEEVQREVAMTEEDCCIREYFMGLSESYEYRIQDRNDSALMHGLLLISKTGSRAVKLRLLFGGE